MQPFSLVFWAIFCVLAGAVLLIRQFTPAVFRPAAVIGGIFILLLGVALLTSPSPGITADEQAVFDRKSVVITADSEHNCVFGQSTVDLTDTSENSMVKINCVFGQCTVKLPDTLPVDIRSSCAFGSVSGEGFSMTLGEEKYFYPGEGRSVTLDLNTAFGQIVLIR